MTAKLNLNKFYKLHYLTFENTLRLHDDSVMMLSYGSAPTALMLSIFSIEELGKVFLISDLMYHYYCHTIDEAGIRYYMKAIHHEHISKQFKCITENYQLNKNYDYLLDMIKNGDLERIKQKSIYAGLSDKDVRGKISSPENISIKQAIKYVNFVNNTLLKICRQFRKGIITMENENIEDLLNDEFIQKYLAVKEDIHNMKEENERIL